MLFAHRGPHRGGTVLFARRGPHHGATMLLPTVPFAQRTVIRYTVDLLRIKLNWNPNFQFAKVTSYSANLCISKFPHIELSLNFRN